MMKLLSATTALGLMLMLSGDTAVNAFGTTTEPVVIEAQVISPADKSTPATDSTSEVKMDREAFHHFVRDSLFGGHLTPAQIEGIDGILDAFATHGGGRLDTLAYALATAYHETGRRMVPVREGFARSDDHARRILRHRRYASGLPPHGHAYYGRGHVQLTWKSNYARSSADAGVDLVANPDAMLDPEISARILIKGLLDGRWNGHGRGIGYYLDRGDLKNARRTVNVLDRWARIARYHRKFLAALEAVADPPKPEAPIS